MRFFKGFWIFCAFLAALFPCASGGMGARSLGALHTFFSFCNSGTVFAPHGFFSRYDGEVCMSGFSDSSRDF